MQAVAMLVGRCDKHAFEASHDLCNDCGREFCPECLVYPFGTSRSPICVDCALTKSGVRKNAGRGRLRSRREVRKERKLLRCRREEQGEESLHSLTLDDLPMVVPMAESIGPAVRPLDEAVPAAPTPEIGDADVFGDHQTSIMRPSPVTEVPVGSTETDEESIPLRDLTRPQATETSPLSHEALTDETIRETFPEPLAHDEASAMVPAGAPRRGYTFDPSMTEVS